MTALDIATVMGGLYVVCFILPCLLSYLFSIGRD